MTTETNNNSDSKEWIASKLYLSSLYFVTVGILYLWGYWPTFGVNILEYLDLADIIKVTAYPVALTVIVIAVGSLGGEFLSKAPIERLDARLESAKRYFQTSDSSAELDQFRRHINRFRVFILSVYFIAASFGIYLYLIGSRHAWTVLPIVVTLPAARSLSKHRLITERFTDENTQIFVAIMLTATCAFSHGFGRTASHNIVDGTSYSYVISEFPTQPEKKIGEKLRYVGHAGEFIFFYDPVRIATVISESQDDKPLVLKGYSQRVQLYTFQDISLGFQNLTRIFR